MISIIENNYFKITLVFLSVISFYCMAGLIVPLQFIFTKKLYKPNRTPKRVIPRVTNLFAEMN